MLAPILVSIYNRKKSLLECIEYLKKSKLASESVLYIVSDFAYKQDDIEIIEEIREEIKEIKGFKKVISINNKKNLGSFVSLKLAIDEVVNKHGKIIFLEDDIRVSPYFLEYMNEALNLFEDNKKIFSISGYLFPIKEIENSKNDIFIWERYCPWGMGIWKDRWNKIDWDLKEYDKFVKDKEKVKKFNNIEPNAIIMLERVKEGIVNAMDAKICFHSFNNNLYTIYPKKTLTVNRGHDGSGEHCGEDEKYYNQELDENFNPILIDKLEVDKRIYRALYLYHYSFLRHVVRPLLKKIGLLESINKLRYFLKRKFK